ncbi:hypothetical protein BURCENBC7_AP3409 [Burkholderia cenocepacia BC7]|nr:hypothetical protein BURCENBC7_AP3409 [Burkholderia cenocepacia BC7]
MKRVGPSPITRTSGSASTRAACARSRSGGRSAPQSPPILRDPAPRVGRQLAARDEAQHFLVIAAHDVTPRPVEQVERGVGGRAAVDEIADREQPVARRIEADVVQQRAQHVHAAVQVADDEVAAGRVRGMAAEQGGGSHPLILGARAHRHVTTEWR